MTAFTLNISLRISSYVSVAAMILVPRGNAPYYTCPLFVKSYGLKKMSSIKHYCTVIIVPVGTASLMDRIRKDTVSL